VSSSTPSKAAPLEIVTDRESKTPDRAAATAIVNGLRRRRVRLLEDLAAVLEEST
jgi:4-aminobutyrate aminotransferase-like enzyme